MKKGEKYTVERALTGYIIYAGSGLCLHSTEIHAFSHKEQVLAFLRTALTLDLESGLAKERTS